MVPDGFVKSPPAALHFIFLSRRSVGESGSSLRRTLSTPHSKRFARLASGTFFCAVYSMTSCELIENEQRDSSVKPLQPYPQCVDCLVGLAQSAADMSTSDDSSLKEKVEIEARRILEQSRDVPLTSPQVANRILREITRRSGNVDPYSFFKIREIEIAKRVFEGIQVEKEDDLRSHITLAVLGNSIDFFRDPEDAFSEIPDQMKRGISFSYDDIEHLETFLNNDPKLVLYLTDNAGEVFFDLPLYDYVCERSERTVLIVKGGPSINDLTRQELKVAGLEHRFDEIVDTGTEGVGIDWDEVSDDFRNLLDGADLVLSKGMANFETLYPRSPKPPTFYIFRVKCRPIQDYVNGPMGSFVALWQE